MIANPVSLGGIVVAGALTIYVRWAIALALRIERGTR